MSDPTTTIQSRATAVQRAGTDDLRRAIATTRHRLLEVLYARAQALGGVTGWVGPHRERFDAESNALLAAGRELDDALATLLYALDDELDALRGARPSTLSEAASTMPLETTDHQVGPDTNTDTDTDKDLDTDPDKGPDAAVTLRSPGPGRDASLRNSARPGGRERQRVIRDAPVIPIRRDLEPT